CVVARVCVLLCVSLQPSSAHGSALKEQEEEAPPKRVLPSVEGAGSDQPDLSALSLSEKMALFNRLSQSGARPPDSKPPPPHSKAPRGNARFQPPQITHH